MSATRRDLLSGVLAAGAVAAFGLALEDGEAQAGIVQPLIGATTEAEVLSRLLAFEQLEVFAYDHIERTSVLSADTRSTLAHFLAQERRHVELLSAELKKRGVPPPKPPSGVPDADRRLAALLVARRLSESHDEFGAIKLLIGIETVAETIYYLALQKLPVALAQLAAGILGCEAQHWTGLSALLHDGDPVHAAPRAFVPFTAPPS